MLKRNAMDHVILLAKEAESRKEEIEALRNLPQDLVAKVKSAGLVKMWAAKDCGGAEADVLEVSQMIRSISYHNGSLAWVVAVTGCSSLFSGYLKHEQAKPLFGHKDAMIGGFAGPAGIATKSKDGLLVSGRWSWGSGISHCSHIVGGVRLMDQDQMVGTAIVFMHPSEIKVHDNWHVLGLKGSHSIDYSTKDLLVPNDRWSYFPLKKPMVDSPIYRFSFLGALSVTIASVGLGLAKCAIDEIELLSKSKSPFGMGRKLSERAIFQSEFAMLKGTYKSAIALFDQTIRNVQEEVQEGVCSKQSKGDIRLASAFATKMCTQVVSEAYRLGGGSSIRKSNKLEELMRDMNVVSQHGMVSHGNFRTVGSLYLGNEVPEFLL